ncbi:MAG TPA: thioredoxin [Steroidobacteraceae bacterium]|nr:thioredoxin [Steroidobacteraceae bacterium]
MTRQHAPELGQRSAMITELDTASFESAIKDEKPVLVDFWAPWCGPCRVQLPILDRLASSAGDDYRLYKVNVDDHANLAQRFRISSIPTLLLFRGGELIRQFRGLQNEDTLRRALQDAAAPKAGAA